MSVLRRAKLRTPDGTESIEYPLGVEAENVEVANRENLSQRLVRIDEDLEKNEEDIAAVSELAGTNKQNIGANEIRIDALERRSASVNKKPYYFDTVADMKAYQELRAGDMAITLGYYEINDGGGAEYKIRNKNNEDIEDNGSIYFINNNLVIQLIDKKDIKVEVFGIFGNNADETVKIQNIFNYVKNKKIKIIFGKEKTYILRAPINLGEFSLVEGNKSMLLIDSIIDTNNSYQFIKDNGFNGNITLIDWNNININITADTMLLRDNSSKTRPYSIFETGRTKTFKMSGCSIVYTGNERNQITFFKFKGHGKIFMNDCYFENNHRGIYGSSLWIQSSHSNEIYYGRFKNCTFCDTCRDETISIYNPNGHDIVFENCIIKKEFYNDYYPEDSISTEMINPDRFLITDIHAYKNDINLNTDNHYSSFYNCTLICVPKESENNNIIPNIYILAGHNDNQTKDFLKFNNCKIKGVRIKNIGYGGYNKTVNSLVQYYDYEILKFIDCEIELEVTDSYGFISPCCWNLFIENTNININKTFYNCYWQRTNTGSSPNLININNSRVIMKNLTSESIIFHTVEKSHQNFKITNNDFICLNSNDEEVTPTLNILYSSDNGFSSSNVFLYNNSSYIFFEQNNRINYNTLNSSI